jgi:hypothetical protein
MLRCCALHNLLQSRRAARAGAQQASKKRPQQDKDYKETRWRGLWDHEAAYGVIALERGLAGCLGSTCDLAVISRW